MAEITKVTTPIVPRENIGSKNRPATEQAFELNHPDKVNKAQESPKSKITDRDPQEHPLRGQLNNEMVRSLMRDTGSLAQNLQKMFMLLQVGVSTSSVMQDPHVKQLFNQLFGSPEQLMETLQQQDEASVLFKGKAFAVLRDALMRFEDHQGVKDAIVNLLKTFEQNINAQNSIKTILYNCQNILDYMFTKDREQFDGYLKGLAEMLLSQTHASAQSQEGARVALVDEDGNPEQGGQLGQGDDEVDEDGNPIAKDTPAGLSQKEAANILKSNLLPLLGEVVVKYHQNAKIRDIVMVIVHNIVRVDKGTPEGLRDAVEYLTTELKKVANLPENFATDMLRSLQSSTQNAKEAQNQIMEKLADIIGQTLRNDTSSAPMLRQAENLLFSVLQNQSSMMGILHFILPMVTIDDRLFAEMYVDPESDEKKGGRESEQTRKIFLTAESENHGLFELCFWQTGDRVDFSMWCPQILVKPLGAMRRTLGDLMQIHGFTMNSFTVEEFVQPHSVAQVFPRLLNRRMGIDVRI